MLISDWFVSRVQSLAASHFRDWHYSGGRGLNGRWTNQDFWLLAQYHVRNMGDERDGLVEPCQFIEWVRRQAESRWMRRNRDGNPHGDGPNQDFDLAWLDCLIGGLHLKSQTRWASRDSGTRAASVCFLQGSYGASYLERVNEAMSGFDNFEIPVEYHYGLDGLIGKVDETRRAGDGPRAFCVQSIAALDNNELCRVIEALNRRKIAWRGDQAFFWARRDALKSRHWANEAAAHYPPALALQLAMDIAMN